MDEWQEVEQGEVKKLEVGEILEGEFVGTEQSKKYPESFAFRLKNKDGKILVTFVSQMVLDMIDAGSITKGDKVRLEYHGLKKNEAGTREYKNYRLFLSK